MKVGLALHLPGNIVMEELHLDILLTAAVRRSAPTWRYDGLAKNRTRLDHT